MFSGSMVALITPMDKEGELDFPGLKKLVDYHVASGTSAIVSTGTTGEAATLTAEEQHYVVMKTLEFADGRIPVIAGTGANATKEAIRRTQSFAGTGVAGCLAVTPYYNKPTQEGLFQHFKAIDEHTDLPQILYNVPSRTGCDLLPDTVGRLAELSNIVAIKEATGNLNRISQIQARVGKDFVLLCGEDAITLDFMQLGGKGVISVTANVAAPTMAKLCTLVLQGDLEAARTLNQQLMMLHQQLFIETNPIPVKWACHRLGLIDSDAMRLPLVPLTDVARIQVQQALAIAGLL